MNFDLTKLDNKEDFEKEFESVLSQKIKIELNNRKEKIADSLLSPTKYETEESGENS